MLSCVIVGASEIFFDNLPLTDLVIAADGGLQHLRAKNINPDVIIGDFDSLAEVPQNYNIIQLPREKDVSDMRAAIDYAWEQHCRVFHIYGGTDGRLDHTLANIQCLADIARKGGRGWLYGEREKITCVCNGVLEVSGTTGVSSPMMISVFSHGDHAEGVTLSGLKYPLKDAILRNTNPIGLSNEFIGGKATISVECGMLVVVVGDVI